MRTVPAGVCSAACRHQCAAAAKHALQRSALWLWPRACDCPDIAVACLLVLHLTLPSCLTQSGTTASWCVSLSDAFQKALAACSLSVLRAGDLPMQRSCRVVALTHTCTRCGDGCGGGRWQCGIFFLLSLHSFFTLYKSEDYLPTCKFTFIASFAAVLWQCCRSPCHGKAGV